MKVFYIGSDGPLSVQPLQWLLSSRHTVCGIGIDAEEDHAGQVHFPIIQIEQNSLATLARQQDIPLIDLFGKAAGDVVTTLKRLRPDLILVSCYGHKLSDEVLNIPRFGSVNCHPSLLPAYRGPAPLFWQYRNGEDPVGITLHFMNSEWDAGDVIAAVTMPVIDGQRTGEVNQSLALLLCDLLAHTLEHFPDGVTPIIQEQKYATYQGYPDDGDFQVSSKWSARRIYNFMRITEHWGRAYPCQIDGRLFQLKRALVYSENNEAKLLAGRQDIIHVKCNPGILVASYYH